MLRCTGNPLDRGVLGVVHCAPRACAEADVPGSRAKVNPDFPRPSRVRGASPQEGGRSKRSLTSGVVSAHLRERTRETGTPAQPKSTAASSPRVPSVSVRRLSLNPVSLAKHHRAPSTKQAGRNSDGTVKPHKPSKEIAKKVEQFLVDGYSINEISLELDLRPGQIRQYYAKELALAEVRANGQVARTLHKEAVAGNVPAAVFWMKSRGGAKWNPDRDRGLGGLGSLAELLMAIDSGKIVDGEVLSSDTA